MLYFSDDNKYGLQTSGDAWSFTNTNDTLRFEVRPGDHWSKDDVGVERAEAVFSNLLNFGQTYSIDYSFMVEPGAANTSDWVNIGQLHGSADAGDYGSMAPIFAVQLMGEKLRIVSRSDPNAISTGRAEDQILYKDTADIVRGQWYDIKIDIKVDPFGNGDIDVYRDGVQIVDYHGAVGYNDAAGPYWREGVYRAPADETLAVNFKDLEVSTIDTTSSALTATVKTVNGTKGADVLMGGVANEDFKSINGNDSINGAGGSDTIDGGTGSDTLDGGDGDDKLIGGTSNDVLSGGSGADMLSGGDNNDVLVGGDGADTLAGGDAADTLTGGAGADVFRFDDRWNGPDHLVDFTVGEDKIQLDVSEFGVSSMDNVVFVDGLGSTVAGKAALHYVASTGQLYWDSTGGATTDVKLIAVLDNHAKLSAGDFSVFDPNAIVESAPVQTAPAAPTAPAAIETPIDTTVKIVNGTKSAEVLMGSDANEDFRSSNGADSVYAAGGNDTVDGETGADTLDGGIGNDMLIGGTNNDKLIGGDGADTLIGGNNGDTLIGGAGGDVFRFDGAWYEADRLVDFKVGEDKIQIVGSAFGVSSMNDVVFANGLGSTVAGKAALHYVETTGQLYWDPTGGSTGDAKLLATLDNHAQLAASSFELF